MHIMSDPKAYPSALADKFQLRMPDGLRPRIAAAAKAAGRSMNTEIIMRLENSLAAAPLGVSPYMVRDEPDSPPDTSALHALIDTLPQGQAAALHALLLAMRGEPAYYGTEYESPHAADAAGSRKPKKAI